MCAPRGRWDCFEEAWAGGGGASADLGAGLEKGCAVCAFWSSGARRCAETQASRRANAYVAHGEGGICVRLRGMGFVKRRREAIHGDVAMKRDERERNRKSEDARAGSRRENRDRRVRME